MTNTKELKFQVIYPFELILSKANQKEMGNEWKVKSLKGKGNEKAELSSDSVFLLETEIRK